ncbi:proton-associated sugar transporter A [Elysia marginata]|uniref:Proton-associated sugar transporter A n=1 Tax=Elysia marginata TaxID=1093978 RepID=A0AAV4JG88_9GAST|nr:proton-associated sugar transporter A [Elysia marginata]
MDETVISGHKKKDEESVLIRAPNEKINSSKYCNGSEHCNGGFSSVQTSNETSSYCEGPPGPKGSNNSEKKTSQHRTIIDLLWQNRTQIQVNALAFGTMGATSSFGVFGTNFVGTGIFEGDPAAPGNSLEYHKFLHGVTVGSRGTLLYFIVFAIFSLFHQKSLKMFGWKKETIFVTSSYFVLCVTLALSKNVYVFYLTSIGTGFIRTIAMTVPYILTHKISAEKDGGQSSGTAISLVAAMLPCGVLICTLIMGPLIEATGTSSVSILYTGACSALACVFACVLNI